jgi:hypothetical protein
MGSRAVCHQQYFERPDRPERHQGGKTGILENDAFLTAVFLGQVIQQQRPTMLCKVGGLGVKLFGNLIRQLGLRPDLAVRMRVRTAHYSALILEDLRVADKILCAQVGAFARPGFQHVFDGRIIQFGQGQVVAGRETHHLAQTALGAGGTAGDGTGPRCVSTDSGNSAAKSLSKTNGPV